MNIPPEYRWNTIPEILYEAPKYPGAKTDPIPFIEVPKDKKMPPVLFLFEYKLTGELEPDEKGMPQEITEQIPHKYVDLEFLMDRLSANPEIRDKVRVVLGMQPLAEAKEQGEELLNRALSSVNNTLVDSLKATQEERIQRIKEMVETQTKKKDKK